jgi:hypothetical protein
MTVSARKVLRDCEFAYECLELEEDERKFKLLWVSCVSLLRAVGHVLKKVDCPNDPLLKTRVDQWWARMNSEKEKHKVFFEFIEQERNNLLKEYEMGFLSGEMEVLVGPQAETFTLSGTEYCPMSYGLFEGEDCREVVHLAISWWAGQLKIIDEHQP